MTEVFAYISSIVLWGSIVLIVGIPILFIVNETIKLRKIKVIEKKRKWITSYLNKLKLNLLNRLLTFYIWCITRKYVIIGLILFKIQIELLKNKFYSKIWGVEIKDKKIIISYYLGRWYKIILKHNNKRKHLKFFDENKNDITSQIIPYLGFQQNFHNQQLTPRDLGYTTVEVEDTLDDENIINSKFKSDDIIII